MAEPEDIVRRIGELLDEVEALDEPARGKVLELLDGLELLHRSALQAMAEELGEGEMGRLAAERPAVSWLLDVYEIPVDQRAEAEAALESVRPYIASHGGTLEVLSARRGVVRVRLGGSCSGCTASAQTLQQGVEEALRRHMPTFAALEVEPDDAPPHPPPAAPTPAAHQALPDQPAPAGAVLPIHRHVPGT